MNNNARDDWDRWWSTTGYKWRVQEFAEKHRASPQITPREYFAQKRGELAKQLDGMNLIYLDTNHWVNLRHVVVKSPKLNPAYIEILALMETLRRKGRICSPVSAALFMELMKQEDKVSRQATARIMDNLSGGVCLQNWLDLIQAEFGRHVCRTFQIKKPYETLFPLWTMAGFWAGEYGFKCLEIPEEDSTLAEKTFIDLYWGMTFEECQLMPDWIAAPDAFSVACIDHAERAKFQSGQIKPSFNELVQERRFELLCAISGKLKPLLPALCCGLPGSPSDHVAAVLDPVFEGGDTTMLPSVEVVAGLDAALSLESTRKMQANDMLDFLHAAQALPYCDALFCDNFMAQKLRHKPLEFGKVYKTEIGSRPEEIVAYLKALI